MSEEISWFSTTDFQCSPCREWGPAVWLALKRVGAGGSTASGRAVLLLHGASANHRTFEVERGGLAGWLLRQGYDPWLLDWRGSGLVVGDSRNEDTLKDDSDIYTFNRAAMEDVPAAICRMRSFGVRGPIAAVGHCMGGAVLAEAVAQGFVETADLDRVVLLTLGLFYEASIDSRVKSEERILERLKSHGEGAGRVVAIDPGATAPSAKWPEPLDLLYQAWPRSLRAHDESPAADAQGRLCNRLGFLYGMPYHHQNLVDSIHGRPEALQEQFGAIPLAMFIHAARNLRHRQATFYDRLPAVGIVSDEARERFARLTSVTLITGALNRLWHRDSIDRMYEWLRRGPSRRQVQLRKHVLPTYGHQDLLWGRSSPREVYPLIARGLGLELDELEPDDPEPPPGPPLGR